MLTTIDLMARYNRAKFTGQRPAGSRRRFDLYDPLADLSKPEVTGVLWNERDLLQATPNMGRAENVSLIAGNASDSCAIRLHFKWRPRQDGHVVLFARLDFVTADGRWLEFERLDSYKPQLSDMFDGKRFTVYGGPASPLHLYVLSPYRRLRLVFRGHMRLKGNNDPQASTFVRIQALVHTFTEVYDFLEDYDVQYMRSTMPAPGPAKGGARGLESWLRELALEDRHEHLFKLRGEYRIGTEDDKHRFTVWGFHVRCFWPLPEAALSSPTSKESTSKRQEKTLARRSRPIERRRLLAFANNGQAFHLVSSQPQGDKAATLDYGYTCFMSKPAMRAIDQRPLGFQAAVWAPDSNGWGAHSKLAEAQVSGQGASFPFSVEPRATASFLSALTYNGKPGWALAESELDGQHHQATVDSADGAGGLHDTSIDPPELAEAMEACYRAHLLRIEERRLAAEPGPSAGADEGQAPLVVRLDDDMCLGADLVGAKAASLAQLRRLAGQRGGPLEQGARFQVPNGAVLTRHALEQVLASNAQAREAAAELELRLANSAPLDEIRAICEQLQATIERGALPAALGAALEEALAGLVDEEAAETGDGEQRTLGAAAGAVPWAVRSSSWGEDEADMSAAGQLSSLLGVRGKAALEAAALTCFASKYSLENVQYKRQHGLAPSLPMAVVVQRMVDVSRAGVMFTSEPASGDPALVAITANYGLGESVVSGQAEPDSILVRVRDLADEPRLERLQMGAKAQQVRLADEHGADQRQYTRQTEQADRERCCLEEGEWAQLARVGRRVETYFNAGARDIEWGLTEMELEGGERRVRVHLFQSRPVTGQEAWSEFELMHEADFPSRAEVEFASRANVCEVMPFATSPFSITYFINSWACASARLFTAFGVDTIFPPYCQRDIIVDSYYAFFGLRASPWLKVGVPEEDKTPMSRALELAFSGHELGTQPEIVEAARGYSIEELDFTATFGYRIITLKVRWAPMATARQGKRLARSLFARQRHQSKLVRSDPKISAQQRLERLYQPVKLHQSSGPSLWYNHVVGSMLSTSSNMELLSLLARYVQDPAALFAAMNKILSDNPNQVISAEIPARIERLATIAQRAQSTPPAADHNPKQVAESEQPSPGPRPKPKPFAEMSEDEAEAFIAANAELKREFDQFFEIFGHRCYHEFDVSQPRWSENRGEIIRMVQRCGCVAPQPQPQPPNENGASAPPPKKAASQSVCDQVIDRWQLRDKITLLDKLKLRYLVGPRGQLIVAVRECTKDALIDHMALLRDACLDLANELCQQHRLPDADLIFYLFNDELPHLVRRPQPALVAHAARRRNMFKRNFSEPWKYDEIIRGHDFTPLHLRPSSELDAAIRAAPKLTGTPASSGRVTAPVRLVRNYHELDRIRLGDILVTHSTDIAFSPVFPLCAGIVTEVGGIISHGAVVAREYGLPSVLGVTNATQILEDGETVLLDADLGQIVRLGRAEPSDGAETAPAQNSSQ